MPYLAAPNVVIGPDDVAITLGYGVLGTHLGVAVQDESGTAVVMDLSFHRLFRTRPFPSQPGEWSAAVVPLPPIASASLAAMLRALGANFAGKDGSGPNYGINLKLGEGSIQPDGTYVPPAGSDGHTCATIIADVFRSARFPLVNISTWNPSDENLVWGDAIVCMLLAYAKKKPASQAFGQAKVVKANNAGFRLLPEEVAAAGQLNLLERPASQSALVQLAQQAVAEMRAACVAPPTQGIFENCAKRYSQQLAKLTAQRQADDAAKAMSAPAVSAPDVVSSAPQN